MKNISVFCGSSTGHDAIYAAQAKRLGVLLAEQDLQLVYGAGNVGLMGVIADAVLEKKGKVLGVIPQFLKDWEVAHQGLTEIIITETMHQRKQIMFDRSDGAIAMAGGFGTLDEVFEMVTWGQLELHDYPIGFLNTKGYYDNMIKHADHMVTEGFLKKVHRDALLISDNPKDLLMQMSNYKKVKVEKWVDK